MLNDLQASIEHEEEMVEGLKNEMSLNIGVDIEQRDNKHIFGVEAQCELYPDCSELSSLNFLVKLMHVKVLNGLNNNSFNMLLKQLKGTFQMCSTTIPSSFNKVK